MNEKYMMVMMVLLDGSTYITSQLKLIGLHRLETTNFIGQIIRTLTHILKSFFQFFNDGGPLSYRNQSIDFYMKMDWFLYERCRRHERLKPLSPSSSQMDLPLRSALLKFENGYQFLTKIMAQKMPSLTVICLSS